jgi:hypothetical protein
VRVGRFFSHGALFALAVTTATLACNDLLGNRPGHLVDAAVGVDAEADATDAADAAYEGLDAVSGEAEASPIPEATTGLDAPGDPVGWSPSALGPALALWLEGDRGVTTAPCAPNMCVTRWADRSGNANDAFLDQQLGNPPVQVPGLYNGHGALRFDGSATTLVVDDSLSLQIGSAFTILAVAAEPHAFHEEAFYTRTAGNYPYSGIGLWGNYTGSQPHGTAAVQIDMAQYVVSTDWGLDNEKLRLFAATLDGMNLSLIVDNGLPVTMPVTYTPPLGPTGAMGFIGGDPLGGQVLAGDLAELILVTRTLDASEWALMRGYIQAKYGIM